MGVPADDNRDYEAKSNAEDGEDAQNRALPQSAARACWLTRHKGAGETKADDETDQAPAQRRPTLSFVAWLVAALVPGGIGGGAERATASMSRVRKPASVLVKTCLHRVRVLRRQSTAATKPGCELLPSSIPASGP